MFNFIKNKYYQGKLKDKNFSFLFDQYDGDEVVVFDTETTGLNPKKDEILSIGAVKVKKDSKIIISKPFERYVKPSKNINIESIKIHHIRHVDLENAQDPTLAIKEFLEFIGNRPLVGYYLEFDIAMINKYIKPLLGIKLPNKQIEVSGLYHDKKIKFIPDGIIDLRFDEIMKDLKLPMMGKHDATNDAIMTAMIYVKLQNCTKI